MFRRSLTRTESRRRVRAAAAVLPTSLVAAGGLAAATLLLPGCGSDSGTQSLVSAPADGGGGSSPAPAPTAGPTPTPGTSPAPSPSGIGRVTGRVFAPDGALPLSGAVVYVPATRSAAIALRPSSAPGRQAAPPEPAVTSTVSDVNGDFTLENVPAGEAVEVRFVKGKFAGRFTLSLSDGQTAAATARQTTLPATGQGAARIAVITGRLSQGTVDRIEDLLAKLGMGQVASGALVPGTQQFDLIDDPGPLFLDPARLGQYSIVCINSGADEGPISRSNPPVRAAVQENLRAFVEQGGTLLVTDRAYDYVEQVFPAAIEWSGGPEAAPITTPETSSDAETGSNTGRLNGDIRQAQLRDWLQARGVLTSDATVPIEPLVLGWAQASGGQDAIGPGTTMWMDSLIPHPATVPGGDFPPETNTDLFPPFRNPLLVSFRAGRGSVIFSTFHAAPPVAQDRLLPQQMALLYLLFEL